MRVAIASDHAGFRLKGVIAAALTERGHEVSDLGTDSEASVDYPAFCAAAGRAVVQGKADCAVVMGGSGQGEAIAANKVHGVRAALCPDEFTARLARQHNDANVLAMGSRIVAEAYAVAILDVFLTTGYEGGRHDARIQQLRDIEHEECAGA